MWFGGRNGVSRGDDLEFLSPLIEAVAAWGAGEWSLVIALMALLGIDGTRGWKFLGYVRRGFKIEEPKPLPVIVHSPVVPDQPVETRPASGLFINVPAGREVIGRADELVLLHTKLKAAGDVVVRNSGAILSGQGGIGKTTLARAYAMKYADQYDGVLWVAAETRQGVIEGLMHLCAPLGMPRPEQPQEGHAVDVLTALQGAGQCWLIVYDNVEDRDDIRKLIPRGSHLIATTRQGEGWTGFTVQETDVLGFDKEDGAAVELLMDEAGYSEGRRAEARPTQGGERAEARRAEARPTQGGERAEARRAEARPTKGGERAEARALAAALGGLPLALVMAGGLIRRERLGFGDYLDQVSRIIAAEPKNADYPDSVIGAVRLSYDKLNADAKLVADLFAWWAPEGLEARLITGAPDGRWEGRDDVPDEVRVLAEAPERVVAAVEELEDRSLLRRDVEGFALHRMTGAALRAMQGEASQAGAAAALLAAVYPGGANGPVNSGTWPDCRRLTPHVRALWDMGAAPATAAMDYVLNQSSIFLEKTGDYAGGIEMARASLVLKSARLPETHRDIALGHATFGVALQRLGAFDEAGEALQRAVDLGETHHAGSADLAQWYDLHGGLLLDIGRAGDRAVLVAALRRYQQAAAIWHRLVGRDSDDRARVLNNLATVRDSLGQGAAALRLSGYALAIYRRVLPPGDARLGYGFLNTGAMALKARAADRAEPLLEEALALWRAVYVEAPRHEDIVDAAGWLVSCLLARAGAGENRGRREMAAKRLCAGFGFGFEERVEQAKQYPYAGAGA